MTGTPELAFATASAQAFEEAEAILSPLRLSLGTSCRLAARASSIAGLAQERVRALYARDGRPCFTIESALLPSSDLDTSTASDRWYDESDITQSDFCREFAGLKGVVAHVLAFTRDGKDIVLFQRDMPGEVSPRPRGDKGTGFDQIWIPHGYTKPYAELAGGRLALNKRKRLLYDLADYLKLPVKEGFYEIHITVEDDDHETFRKFKATCAEFGMKAIQIELPHGVIPTHLITASFHQGAFRVVRTEAESIAALFSDRGFKVTRLKIESMMNNELVPLTDKEATDRPDSNYFEFHVKVPLRTDSEAAQAKAICKSHGAYLSRNPSNQMNDGIPLRFCTLRIRGKGSQSAIAIFDAFLNELRNCGFKLSNILREYTVFDSNLGLDDGWAKSLDQTKFCFSECEHIKLGDCPFATEYDYIVAPNI